MSSPRKINSARANGANSRGPKSESGRKASSMNAVTHGLYSKSVVLQQESAQQHREMLDAYIRQFQPHGQAEFEEEDQPVDDIVSLSFAYHELARGTSFPFLNRNESRLERAHSRALKTFLELQLLRQPAPTQNSQKRTESQIRTPQVFPSAHTPPRTNQRPVTAKSPPAALDVTAPNSLA